MWHDYRNREKYEANNARRRKENGENPNNGQITFLFVSLMRQDLHNRFPVLIKLLQNGLMLLISKRLNKCHWKYL